MHVENISIEMTVYLIFIDYSDGVHLHVIVNEIVVLRLDQDNQDVSFVNTISGAVYCQKGMKVYVCVCTLQPIFLYR